MRGKKPDNEFVSQFISECLLQNKTLQEEIKQEAQNQIDIIDLKIKEVEQLKKIRTKLLDVIDVFGEKKLFKKEKDILDLFKISHKDISNIICNHLLERFSPINIEENIIFDLMNIGYAKQDIINCLQQLQNHQVIYKTGIVFLQGKNFYNYIDYVINGKNI